MLLTIELGLVGSRCMCVVCTEPRDQCSALLLLLLRLLVVECLLRM